MSAAAAVVSLAGRMRRPQTTVRWRLALLYGALFLFSGAVLLTVTYVLVEHAATATPPRTFVSRLPPTQRLSSAGGGPVFGGVVRTKRSSVLAQLPPRVVQALRSTAGQYAIRFVGDTQRLSDLHQLIVESSVALAIMAIISAGLGWLVAGRVLRPLRTMTAATQQISEANLHERLALGGPRDELRQLADTIDGLLARLEAAFEAQRRFVANASHELRTPLTAARALLEMVITDPRATVDTFRATCRQVLEESEEQEQLIDSLLTLARSERGIDGREAVDLAAATDAAVRSRRAEAAERGLELHAGLTPAPLWGDRRLVERLIVNLLDNALRHNIAAGHVHVTVAAAADGATLRVVNTGTPVPADEIDRLLAPFQRLAPDRTGSRQGFGLGLSIVAAIAAAHGAALDVRPGSQGGLDVRVQFPSAPALGAGAGTGLRERAAGEERAQRPGLAAHAQRAVGADLQAGPHGDVDRPVLPAGDPPDRPLDVAGDVERAPQQS